MPWQDKGGHVNPEAWNKVANMLYLESPAGSGTAFLAGKGSSQCLKGGKMVGCQWDDVSQAEAYAHTLTAFGAAFPEFKGRELYLTGESYFGQYGPNSMRPGDTQPLVIARRETHHRVFARANSRPLHPDDRAVQQHAQPQGHRRGQRLLGRHGHGGQLQRTQLTAE